MIDELTQVILGGNDGEQAGAKATAVATYGEAEAERRWNQAAERAEQIDADDGYDHEAGHAVAHREATEGLSNAIAEALIAIGDAESHLDELAYGVGYDGVYDPDESRPGRDFVEHLTTARRALAAAKAIHSWKVVTTNLQAAVAELGECAPTEEACRHSQPWPCQATRATWLARGLDVVAEKCDRLDALAKANGSEAAR